MTTPSLESASPVLVVDDDDALRRLVATALQRSGFTVLQAGDGETALRIVEDTAVGVVILDLQMSGMSGLDVVRTLRARPKSATLPVILLTGAATPETLVVGLDAGADDFLAKPVRLAELVARVRAHLRTAGAWSGVVEEELRRRSDAVEAIAHLSLSAVPEEAAETIVEELGKRSACDYVAVSQRVHDIRLVELATYDRGFGVRRGGSLLDQNVSSELIGRSRGGPWLDDNDDPEGEWDAAAVSNTRDLAVHAGAPIYFGNSVVGLLSLGFRRDSPRPSALARALLLAAAIDYASILSAVTGPVLAGRRDDAEVHARLSHVLANHEFHPVFQPIVKMASREVVGYEALTRFDDGIRPDLRFAEAASVGLGHEFEMAAIRDALVAASDLPPQMSLSLNASPGLVLDSGAQLRSMVRGTTRRLVLELTEHVAIDDYGSLRESIAALGDIGPAVDDAGAGYASLRHILELRPGFAKLDISLVGGIANDELRQSLAAGLQYFAVSSGFGLIAEGVESEQDAAMVGQLGIEYGQGYLFGAPATLAAMSA